MGDVLLLIWFINTSEETDCTPTRDQERAHGNPGIKSITKGVNKAVGPHNSTCVCVASAIWSQRIWRPVVLQAAGKVAGGPEACH